MGQIPPIEIPASSNIVTVRVIDTTTRLHMHVGTMFDPLIKGHTTLASPSYSFLIENERLERKVLYDLGTQRKWQEQAPCVVDVIKTYGWDVRVEKDVADILEEHRVSLSAIEAIMWGSLALGSSVLSRIPPVRHTSPKREVTAPEDRDLSGVSSTQ
ncbi:hypothetical protein V502_02036 [Pseudogymnoascus sp. VKM F-4520 (FW-2644)]|nr:hypothetical protein V502_02036 [Pseudogymnoascus sp. VKM F-4520 (FW-2644)]